MMEIAEAHGIEIERVPEDKTKSGLSLLEYKVRTAQEKLAKTEAENSNLEAENTNLKTENANLKTENTNLKTENTNLETENTNLKKANEDFVRSLKPEPTKTVKKLGKPKIVDKTAEEIQRDKEVKAAQAVLKDKDDAAAEKELAKQERERNAQEREELQAERQGMIDYLSEERAKLKAQVQTERQKEHADFEQKITTLKAENSSLKEQNISLKEQMKSVANAIAIRARTMLEKTLRSFGLQMPSGYTVDEQARTAERYSVLEQIEIPKQATPKTNQDVER